MLLRPAAFALDKIVLHMLTITDTVNGSDHSGLEVYWAHCCTASNRQDKQGLDVGPATDVSDRFSRQQRDGDRDQHLEPYI